MPNSVWPMTTGVLMYIETSCDCHTTSVDQVPLRRLGLISALPWPTLNMIVSPSTTGVGPPPLAPDNAYRQSTFPSGNDTPMTADCVIVTTCLTPPIETTIGDAKNPPSPAVHTTAPVDTSNAVSG